VFSTCRENNAALPSLTVAEVSSTSEREAEIVKEKVELTAAFLF
jgi:hypothetical protein